MHALSRRNTSTHARASRALSRTPQTGNCWRKLTASSGASGFAISGRHLPLFRRLVNSRKLNAIIRISASVGAMRRSRCRPRRSRDCMRTTSSWQPRSTAYSLAERRRGTPSDMRLEQNARASGRREHRTQRYRDRRHRDRWRDGRAFRIGHRVRAAGLMAAVNPLRLLIARVSQFIPAVSGIGCLPSAGLKAIAARSKRACRDEKCANNDNDDGPTSLCCS